MLKDTIDRINNKIRRFPFLDLSIFLYSKDELIVAASEDFSYNHKFEIRFKSVFTIICNTYWSVNTKEDCLKILDDNSDYQEACELNGKYHVEAGNIIFRFRTEEDDLFYIIAKDVELVDKMVKYF